MSDSPSNEIVPPVYYDVPSWKVDPHHETKRLNIILFPPLDQKKIRVHQYVAIKGCSTIIHSDITIIHHMYMEGPMEEVIKGRVIMF